MIIPKFGFISGPQTAILGDLSTASVDVAVDTLPFIKSGVGKKVTIANLIAGVAGTVTTTGLTDTAGVLAVDIAGLDGKTTPIADDSVMICDSADTNALKEATLTNLAKPLADVMAGTASATGLSDSSGVLTVAAKIAHLVAGEMSSLFYFATEFDFSGSASAIATKISDHSGASALAAKGTLIAAFMAITQVPNGTTTDVLSISKDSTPTNKMTGDLTITLASTQVTAIGNVFSVMPVSGANAIVDPASEDIYACAAASSGRTAGKVYLFMLFKKTA